MSPAGPARAVDVELFMDYHCPYSHRVTAWLDGLGSDAVRVRHRLFGLEQVNRDPTATEWRLWEQPLDYVHYRDRQDRRPLAAFLATTVVESTQPADVARAFRLGVYAARFDDGADISDPNVLETVATAAGVPRGALAAGLDDPAMDRLARDRIEADWAAARSEFAIFGVPTIRLDGGRPFYLRLARHVDGNAGSALLADLVAFRSAVPDLLELKLPEPIEAARPA